MWKAMAMALVLCSSQAASAEDFRHVRSDQARVRALLAAGYERSATFKRLVDDIESLHGIVYVDETPAFAKGLDGALLHRVAGSRELPILRVLIRTNLASAYGIAILAHELQHVREVLRAGAAVTPQTMTAFFTSLGGGDGSTGAHLETRDAQKITAQVIKELGRQSR
jgi:hypothetical protein